MSTEFKVVSGCTGLGEDDERIFCRVEDGVHTFLYFAYGNIKKAVLSGISEILDYSKAIQASDDDSREFLENNDCEFECALYVADEIGNQGIIAWDCADRLICDGGLQVDIDETEEFDIDDIPNEFPELLDILEAY